NAQAKVTADADVVALVGSSAHLSAPSASIDVRAEGINSATASAVVVSVGGFVAVSGAFPTASVAGGVQAELDGAVLQAANVTVGASGDTPAHTSATAVGGSVLAGIAFSGADATVSDQAYVLAAVGSTASIHIAGTLLIEATGENEAKVTSTIGS